MMTKKKDTTDYTAIREHCEKTGRITEGLTERFLIPFAAERYGLEKNLELRFNRYRQVLSKFTKTEVNWLKSQYLVHKIFKRGGVLEKILKHPAIKSLSDEERNYLVSQAEVPWRFSFSDIDGQPAKDFYA